MAIPEGHEHSIYCNCGRPLTAENIANYIDDATKMLEVGIVGLEPYVQIIPWWMAEISRKLESDD